jgi:hypothetical protein
MVAPPLGWESIRKAKECFLVNARAFDGKRFYPSNAHKTTRAVPWESTCSDCAALWGEAVKIAGIQTHKAN